MKFLCDRCKTRYSIADERVRGKILKIRCKNCSNVITVREGMPEPEPEAPAAAEARRKHQPTDYMPAIMGAAPTRGAPAASPLQSAFAQAMEKPAPPQQLEEEWYVSIDGEQSGPFNLIQAQDWVKARRADDELYCWCEGFDDWLPVEKVSHFRGLRVKEKKPRPAPPPPRAAPREEEPKPLFAAALAALEAEVGAPSSAPSPHGLPAPVAAPAPAKAPAPVSAKAHLPAPNRSKSPSSAPLLARATPLTGTPARPAGRPAAGMFDESEDSPAAAEAPAAASRPVPISLEQLAESRKAGGNGKAAAPAPEPEADEPGDDAPDLADDNDFEIGEVSRVVRLNDVVAAAARRPSGKKEVPVARATAAVQAVKEAAAPASPLAEAALESLHDEHAAGAAPAGDAPALAPVVPPRRRRSQVPMLAAAGVLLVTVIGLIVFFAAGGDDEDTRGGGGAGGDVGNLALVADDPRFPRGTKPGPSEGDPVPDPRTGGKKGGGKKSGGTSGGNVGTGPGTGAGPGTGKTEVVLGPDGQPLEPLTADDVITQALKMSTGTQRCYQRALKDDPFLKVSSIGALITISRDGKVTDVSLDKMSREPLGVCLIAAIKRWPFRKSTAGLNTKITLKFEQTIN